MENATDGSERLNSWKEIAAHLSVSVRTAQRWEKTENLPARRHRHAALDSVFAYRSELNAWWDNRPKPREPQPASAADSSIVVLPFVNLNRDEEGEIFSDGLTEELINTLAQVEGLHVVARTSAFHFKGKTADVRAIGARLGVRHILEGTVRRSEDRLRITAQLIDAADGCHSWSQRYERQMQDVFSLQEEIARAIAETLRGRLAGRRIAPPYRGAVETYALYLEGRHYWNKRTRAGVFTAVDCFERVTARDPGMAAAWAGLANCYLMGEYAGMPPDEGVRRGRTAARKALEIDNTQAEAHCALAFASAAHEQDWAGAEAQFRRALELNPNDAWSHLLYAAMVLAPLGRLEEAMIHQRRACELDPLSGVVTSAMAALCVMLRRYGEAADVCGRALELDPGYPWAHRWRGEAYLLQGLYEEAESEFSKIEEPVFAAGFLGYCYARTNRESRARELVTQLEHPYRPALGLQIAVARTGLGEPDKAIASLLRAFQARAAPGLHWLKIEPIWDSLRGESQFEDLLRRLGVA